MVADGMSMGVPTMADAFSRQMRGRGTTWYRLLRDPRVRHGYFDTGSLSSLVTDSAAASSAWGSGSRVFNGALNVLPDGTKLTPIADLTRGTGRRVGLVTTTQMTHATPAGFAVVQASRDDHAEIAPQYLDKVDVLLAGGIEYFDPKQRADQRDLIQEYRDAGYAFWRRSDELASSAPQKVLGLFGKGHLPFTIDWLNDDAIRNRVPTLADMSAKALEILSATDDGFLLQIEGGRVDHAAHANDAGALLWDQLAFDDAVLIALQFVERHPDTLLIVTSDHGNSNPGLNGVGARYRNTNDCFQSLADAKASYGVFTQRCATLRDGEQPIPVDIARSAARACFGVKLKDHEAQAVADVLNGQTPNEIYRAHQNQVGLLGQVLGNHTGVGWTSVSHTSDAVLLTSIGPGSEQFQGLLLNTDAFDRIMKLWGVEHRNPKMTPKEAKQYLAAVPTVAAEHWA